MALERSDSDLLQRIKEFDIDGTEAALPFGARLASERGWSRPYADRVIREYKRYVYLCMMSDTPVCPSEDVDAAWHLHLTYTRSYWTRFCGEVLGRKLHHEPTKGGPVEAEKHLDMYSATFAAYRAAFREEPPSDIWPPARTRFGDDLSHRDVNTARNWVIPKRPVKRVLELAAVFILLAALVPGCNGNPFELKGEEFLYFLIPMMVGAVCIGRVVRSTFRKPDPQPGDDTVNVSWEQAAFLAGSSPRLTTAAIARLVESGAAYIDGDVVLKANKPDLEPMTLVEQVVYKLMPFGNKPADLKPVREAVEAAFGNEVAELEREGFFMPRNQVLKMMLATILPFLTVMLFLGLPRLVMGTVNNKPVGYLIATIILGGVLGTVLSVVGKYRLTRRGENLLVWIKARHKSKKHTDSADVAMAVALFGTAALAGTSYSFLESWFPRKTADGGCGSGCGSGGCGDGGGGGCGGGGCGGCGGGD